MADASSNEDDKTPSLMRRLSQLIRGGGTATAMRESLEEVIEESERQSPALSAQERTMLSNLLKVGELRVDDVMVPRAEIIAVEESTPLAGLVALFGEAQHSRLPVYHETLDNPNGLVHIKDALAQIESNGEGSFRWSSATIPNIRRPILFVPPSMPVLDLLLKMQTTHIQLALVIDEYGGTDGLVSIEDLIEEIVGDIADEHDEDAVPVRQEGDGFIVDARIDLDDFQKETGLNLAIDDEAEQDIDTVGGLVISLLGRVPQRGEIVSHPGGFEFEVLDADPRRIRKLRVRNPAAAITTSAPA